MVGGGGGVGDVAGAPAVVEHVLHGLGQAVGGLVHLEAVAEHELHGEDLRDGVGDALAGDVGRGAVAGLVERGAVAQGGAGEHAERAREHGGLVGEDVAEGVLGHQDVELGGVVHELHGAVVHEHVGRLDGGVLGGHAVGDLAPQAARLEHVGLVHGDDAVAGTTGGGVEGPADDALHLVLVVVHEVAAEGAGGAVHARAGDVLGALVGAEVDAARQLAHDEHVHALELLGAKRACVAQGVIDAHGAQVEVEAQALADGEKALLRTGLARGGAVPLGAADSGEQHGVGGLGGLERLGGKRGGRAAGGTGGVDGAAADEVLLAVEGAAILLADGVEDLHGLGDDLRADAVAGKQANLVRGVSHALITPLHEGPTGHSARRPR